MQPIPNYYKNSKVMHWIKKSVVPITREHLENISIEGKEKK